MKKIGLFVLLLGIAALVGGYEHLYPTYSYRYRLTVKVEVDGNVHSGSSVIEVTWRGHPPFSGGGTHSPELRGEATLVDLGDYGAVVATLINGEGYGSARDGALGAIWIAPRAFGYGTSVNEIPEFLKERGRRDLAQNNLPRFIWFSNPQDPKTAQKLPVENFSRVIGPAVRFVGASVEITDDSLVTDILNKLSWLNELDQKPPGDKLIRLPNLVLSRFSFIGDKS